MGDFAFASDTMKDIVRIADSLASKSDVTILLLGESGTGKNLLCKRIHEMSSRRNMPFVEIGCSHIPDHLMESELFGYAKGAFTDAKETKKGLFELAHGGTVLLDEIGDMPYPMQSKILTLIEEKRFRRIGGLDYLHVDVRVLAATNRDLPELVHAKNSDWTFFTGSMSQRSRYRRSGSGKMIYLFSFNITLIRALKSTVSNRWVCPRRPWSF